MKKEIKEKCKEAHLLAEEQNFTREAACKNVGVSWSSYYRYRNEIALNPPMPINPVKRKYKKRKSHFFEVMAKPLPTAVTNQTEKAMIIIANKEMLKRIIGDFL